MALTTYTTYDTVRALLGVSPKELEDATLALAVWEQQFLLEMLDVDGGQGNVKAQYAIIAALAANARSTDQQQLFDLVNMIAGYSVAKQILTGAPLAFVQQLTDGRAAFHRFEGASFDKVREGVVATLTQLLRRLRAVLTKLVPTATVTAVPQRTYITSTGLGVDPITGV